LKPASYWEMRSNSGDALARWAVQGTAGSGHSLSLVCDLYLSSPYAGSAADIEAVQVVFRQLSLSRSTLEAMEQRLRAWADLPLSELARTPLVASFEAGHTFDNHAAFQFEPRADVISGPNPVVTFKLFLGKLQGEFVFVTDQSCIRLFCDQVRVSLDALGE
jgi:hypothetical protein